MGNPSAVINFMAGRASCRMLLDSRTCPNKIHLVPRHFLTSLEMFPVLLPHRKVMIYPLAQCCLFPPPLEKTSVTSRYAMQDQCM